MRIESVFGIIWSEDKKGILLIKRRDVPLWVFPGGGVEKGETPSDATIREIREETGLHVIIDRKVATYLPSKPFIKPTELYVCSVAGGTLHVSEEVQDVGFFPLEEIAHMAIPPPFQEFIADALQNLPPIERRISTFTPFYIAKLAFTHPILCFRFFLSYIGLPINSAPKRT